jgi:DNA-binding LytR/AlgR family response regulator
VEISIKEDLSVTETKITIHCKKISPEIEKMIAKLRMVDLKLTGMKDGQMYILEPCKVLYIDTVDKKTFLYTAKDIYETSLRLYELEEQLEKENFFRASKSCIINFHEIISLKPDIDGKILVTMSNKEKLFVSRQYAITIKNKLGVK